MNFLIFVLIIFNLSFSFANDPKCNQINSFLKIGEKYHFSHPKIDEVLIYKAGQIYTKDLDNKFLLFTINEYESILTDLEKNKGKYLLAYKKNPCQTFKEIEDKAIIGEKRYFKYVNEAFKLGPRKNTKKYLENRISEKDLKKYIINMVRNDLFENKKVFSEVKKFHLRKNDFLKNIKEKPSKIIKAFYKAFDPHSDYFTSSESRYFENSLSGKMSGLGINFYTDFIGMKIVKVIPGTPAFLSKKINDGDHILKINNKSVNINNFNTLSKSFDVPAGSKILLHVLNKKNKINKVEIITNFFNEEDSKVSSNIKLINNKKALVINIPSFYFDPSDNTGCSNDFLKEYDKNKNIDIVIIDLRNNAGGQVDQALDIAGYFLGKKIIIYENNSEKIVPFYSNINEEVINKPLIILTNRLSASASEILAGSLQTYGRALILGDESTYGKGTMQTIYPNLKNDKLGLIKLTSSKFYLPNGESNQIKGVISDIVIPNPYENDSKKYFNESKNTFSIPWDKIEPLESVTKNNNIDLSKLKKLSEIRTINDSRFFKKSLKNSDDFILEESLNIAKDYLNLYAK